jgi:hypothetical protein
MTYFARIIEWALAWLCHGFSRAFLFNSYLER